MAGPGSRTAGGATYNLNGTVPRCEHLDLIQPVVPRSEGCQECQALSDDWTGLLICLTCGWVACSDASPHQHAKAHYEETDHPLAAASGPGKQWRWCYVHQRLV